MKALRLTGYMQGWRTKYCHNRHLIQDDNCRICQLGEHRWDPRNETKKAEQYFFQSLTRVPVQDKRSGSDRISGQAADNRKNSCGSPRFTRSICLSNVHSYQDNDSFIVRDYGQGDSYEDESSDRTEMVDQESDCRLCKVQINGKENSKVEANHPEARTVLAPCFHSRMIDICYGFKGHTFKRSHAVIKIYALVIVCLLTRLQI